MTELKAAVRGGANIIGLGDVTNAEMAQAACQLAGKERLVLASVPGNDAVGTLLGPVEVGGPPALVANGVVAVLAQRLVRRLCEHCRVPYKPNPDMLRQANLPPEKVQDFYRPPEPNEPNADCEHCGGTGYSGHLGIFELLPMNDVIRKLVREKAALDVVRNEVAKLGGRTLQEDGLIKVVQGLTSIQALLRVSG
jgi:type II secretory ATPase GspE/PulE/Tfp pilus assembly ATPase PilB-like protein